MDKYKYDYPYIKHLSKAERKEYVSDLPEDLNTSRVKILRTSVLFDYKMRNGLDMGLNLCTQQEIDKKNLIIKNHTFWFCIFVKP